MSPPRTDDLADKPHPSVDSPIPGAFEIIAASARLLFENGQTSQKMEHSLKRLAASFGGNLTISPAWNALHLELTDASGTRSETLRSRPAGVDMSRVGATMRLIDQLCARRTSVAEAPRILDAISHSPPVNIARFAIMAGAGAAALAVIFGSQHLLTLVIVAASAGAGALLRRWLAGKSKNLFIQPFAAALLAGIVGAMAFRLNISSLLRLIAVCPCMVLVPGPHILNAALDLMRMRFRIGTARLIYSTLFVGAISAGLLLGLAIAGANLPVTGVSRPVPLAVDVLAAGIAVAAYGTFFNMSWRLIPIPALVGMLAHAGRWWVLSLGANAVLGAAIACLLVGCIMTPVSAKLHLPFAALAFSSVVSLIPGVYLFRMAGGLSALYFTPAGARHQLLLQSTADATTAISIIAAMTLGLILPKIFIEWLLPSLR
jgi:uncharacterized membrane protein YjjP (DUF1212 family)